MKFKINSYLKKDNNIFQLKNIKVIYTLKSIETNTVVDIVENNMNGFTPLVDYLKPQEDDFYFDKNTKEEFKYLGRHNDVLLVRYKNKTIGEISLKYFFDNAVPLQKSKRKGN